MREIKFRCWNTKQERMCPVTSIWLTDKGTIDHIFSNHIDDTWFHYDDTLVLMQYTGLKDKNGKEIYEGDWCEAQFRDKNGIQVIQGQIIMDEYMWCIDCTGCVGNDIFSINRPHSFKIIGNIYENPDLLSNEPEVQASVATEVDSSNEAKNQTP